MRPKKTRWITCAPEDFCFRPAGVPVSRLEGVTLSWDEFEAVRLLDLEALSQEEASRRMKIHRSTVSRIAASARKKIAHALFHRKALRVEGGCCNYIDHKKQSCC